MLLTCLILVPLLTGLLCLVIRSRWFLEVLNLLAFSITLILGFMLARGVLIHGKVEEWNSFLYADALSAWMILLISFISLVSSIYAVGYLRRDLIAGVLTPAMFREFYVLTPLLTFAMLLVVVCNNLGVMWIALEGTALVSVFLVALYKQKTSLEAAWKYPGKSQTRNPIPQEILEEIRSII